MSIAEKLTQIAENEQKVYDAGYTAGQAQGGGTVIDPDKIIEKTVSGAVICVNDVSEIPHKCTVSVDKDASVWIGGKNLVNINNAVLRDGVTPMPVVDNGVVWKAGNTYWFYILFDTPIPAGTTLYCNWDSETDSLGNDVRYCNVFDENFQDASTTIGPGGVMITTKPVYGLSLGKIYGETPVAEDIVISNIRVTRQVGEDYEPYNGASYNITAGQTVKVDSVCPDMVLYSDNGATITLGYHKSWGMQTEYDRFWDIFQENGNRPHYYSAFAFYGWDDTNYNPKYPITPTNANGIGALFQNNTGITDAKVPISAFGSCAAAFSNTRIRRIPKLIFNGATNVTNMFYGCNYLEEVNCEGEIALSISFAQSNLLTVASVQSIIDCLKDLTGATAQTLTFHATVGAKLTDAQKATITAKNWTLVY